MIPRPEPTEVTQLATQAIEYRKKEGITLLEAIETVCCQALVPTTETPLTIGNVQAYLHLLQDTVIHEVHAQERYYYSDPPNNARIIIERYPKIVDEVKILPKGEWHVVAEVAEVTGYTTDEVSAVLTAMDRSLFLYDLKFEETDSKIERFQITEI